MLMMMMVIYMCQKSIAASGQSIFRYIPFVLVLLPILRCFVLVSFSTRFFFLNSHNIRFEYNYRIVTHLHFFKFYSFLLQSAKMYNLSSAAHLNLYILIFIPEEYFNIINTFRLICFLL